MTFCFPHFKGFNYTWAVPLLLLSRSTWPSSCRHNTWEHLFSFHRSRSSPSTPSRFWSDQAGSHLTTLNLSSRDQQPIHSRTRWKFPATSTPSHHLDQQTNIPPSNPALEIPKKQILIYRHILETCFLPSNLTKRLSTIRSPAADIFCGDLEIHPTGLIGMVEDL